MIDVALGVLIIVSLAGSIGFSWLILKTVLRITMFLIQDSASEECLECENFKCSECDKFKTETEQEAENKEEES